MKKEVKKHNFYLTIYSYLKQGKSIIQLRVDYNIPKQNISYYTKILKKEGLISKIGYGTWELTKKGQSKANWRSKKRSKNSSAGVRLNRPITNLHALEIKFPILKGKIRDADWKIKNQLNNWTPTHTILDTLGGLTLRNNNNKSLTVQAHTRDIKSPEEVDNLAFKIRAYIHDYFQKQGVYLDVFNAETKNINLATEDKAAEGMRRKGEKFTLDLNKRAERIFEKDNIGAKAWIDGSPWDFTAESNDKAWKREYLSMPFRILNMFNLLESITHTMSRTNEKIDYVATNYASHVGMVKEGHKLFKKINKKLAQTKLGNWP